MPTDEQHPPRFNLRSARLNAGFSVRQLADAISEREGRTFGRGVIMRLESGLKVHPANARAVANFFGVDAIDVMPEETEEPNGHPVEAA